MSGKRRGLWLLGSRMDVLATGAETRGAYALYEQTAPPGFGPPLHVHRREDEQFYVLGGEVAFYRGSEVVRAVAGDFVVGPRDIPHTYRITGATPARLLILVTPPRAEAFFDEICEPALDGLPPAPGPDDIQRTVAKIAAAAPKYGIEILGPPPA